ncbi:unnamed protein product [Brassica oleracea var. botrytis]
MGFDILLVDGKISFCGSSSKQNIRAGVNTSSRLCYCFAREKLILLNIYIYIYIYIYVNGLI